MSVTIFWSGLYVSLIPCRYSGKLKSRKGRWVPETDFHVKDKDGKGGIKLNGPLIKADKTERREAPLTNGKDTTASSKKPDATGKWRSLGAQADLEMSPAMSWHSVL